MPIKKYASIWKSCDELRGGMDASQYKDYAEITAIEQRLEKTRARKQGMMQELLTGRTRLV